MDLPQPRSENRWIRDTWAVMASIIGGSHGVIKFSLTGGVTKICFDWNYSNRLRIIQLFSTKINPIWGGCNYPTSNWPYQGHQEPYLVPWKPDYVSPLWSHTDYWPYAPGVCNVTGKLCRILHSWVIEYSLWDSSWDLHCRIHARSGIHLPDLNGQTFHTIPHLNNP